MPARRPTPPAVRPNSIWRDKDRRSHNDGERTVRVLEFMGSAVTPMLALCDVLIDGASTGRRARIRVTRLQTHFELVSREV